MFISRFGTDVHSDWRSRNIPQRCEIYRIRTIASSLLETEKWYYQSWRILLKRKKYPELPQPAGYMSPPPFCAALQPTCFPLDPHSSCFRRHRLLLFYLSLGKKTIQCNTVSSVLHGPFCQPLLGHIRKDLTAYLLLQVGGCPFICSCSLPPKKGPQYLKY